MGDLTEEEVAKALIKHFVDATGFTTVNEDETKTSVSAYYGGNWVDLRVYPMARAVLSLLQPAIEAARREKAPNTLADEILRRRLKFADVVDGQYEMLSDDEHEAIAAAIRARG